MHAERLYSIVAPVTGQTSAFSEQHSLAASLQQAAAASQQSPASPQHSAGATPSMLELLRSVVERQEAANATSERARTIFFMIFSQRRCAA